MLVGMERLGDITARLVAKLAANRELNKNPAARSRKATDGGSDLSGEERAGAPVPRTAIAMTAETIALADRDEVAGRPARAVGVAARAGPKGETFVTGNVIDYRSSPRLLRAWGRLLELPRKSGRPRHVKPRPSRSDPR